MENIDIDINKTENMDNMDNKKDNANNNKIVVQTIKEGLSNSIKPSIEEIERFILFLNKRFSLNLPDNIIINIQETAESTKGFFMPKEHLKHYKNSKQDLNYICLSSHHLKSTPYETIAHEVTHFVNYIAGAQIKNNYHTKDFKRVAESFYLNVEKGKHGFNETSETEKFKEMLKEFIPNSQAFHILQNTEQKPKGSRNLLFSCGCGVKVRTAKNENKPFKAICQYCNTEFKEVKKEGECEDEE